MISVSEAIVLRVVRYSDTRWMVDMLSREWGRVSFACSVSGGRRGTGLRNILQPLSLLSVTADYRPLQEVQRLSSAHLSVPYGELMMNLEKLSVGLFLSEFLVYSTRGCERDERLFDFVRESLLWFDQMNEGVANFHLLFMIRLGGYLGFFPNLEDYREGYVFDLRLASFVGVEPDHLDYVPARESAHLLLLMRMSWQNLKHFRLSHHERNRILDYILAYYRLHVAGFPELKSVDVVKSLFE